MINTNKFALALALVLCTIAAPSFAAVTFSSTQVPNAAGGAALNGFITNDIKVTFTGQYTGSQALIELTGAATPIYQDAVGSAAPPAAAFIGVFPSLAFDSFAAQGSPTAAGPNGDPSLGGGAVDLGGAAGATFTSALINQAWNPAGGVTITDQTDFLIGRFTLAATANGTAKFLASAGGTPVTTTLQVVNGVIQVGGGGLLPTVGDLALVQNTLGQIVAGTVPVTNVTTLGFVGNALEPTFTPLLPGKPRIVNNAPTIGNDGAFSWNTAGALRGTYVWNLNGVNGANSDAGTVTVTVNAVPEPGTLALFGLAIAGVSTLR